MQELAHVAVQVASVGITVTVSALWGTCVS